MTAGNATLVTGATGFIGGRLVERLRECHTSTHVLVRTSAAGERFRASGCEVFLGDITLPHSLASAVTGCKTVIHCAVGGSDLQQAREINVEGTLNLIDAAASLGVRRVVHVSSVVAHGRDWPLVLDESAPLHFEGDHYAVSKAESERAGFERARSAGIEFVVVRPTIVYGPRSGRILVDLDRVNLERIKLIGGGDGLANLIYVEDLVDGLLAAAEHPQAANEAFLMSGESPVPWRNYFAELARMCRKPPPPSIGVSRAHAEAWWSKWHFRFTRYPRRIEDTDFALMCQPSAVSIAKARRLLGFAPRVSLVEGMRRTEAWLRATGFLAPASGKLAA
jgi:nucleoside-diphosphate-sugar epimerase